MRNGSLSIAAGLAMGVLLAVPMAWAQEGEAGWAAAMGHSAPAQKACPAIEWHVLPVATVPATINGVAYFSDMSGISAIKGSVGTDGAIVATLTSVSGTGPAGSVTGMRGKAATHVELHGAGCSNGVLNLRRYTRGGVGGGF